MKYTDNTPYRIVKGSNNTQKTHVWETKPCGLHGSVGFL